MALGLPNVQGKADITGEANRGVDQNEGDASGDAISAARYAQGGC